VRIVLDYKAIDDFYDETVAEFVETDNDGIISRVDLNKLIEANGDVKGWIYIENTDISYPILQGEDNQYYLYRTYAKEYLGAGSIFLDYASNADFTDKHTIVYGHNMHNGSMFGTLDKFMKSDYMEEHKYVYVMLPSGVWNKYEIFGTYIADLDDGTFTIFSGGDENYAEYINLVNSKNMYSGTLEPAGENILTLSTCTEDSNDYKRYVIQAALVGTVDKITSNTNS
jgi:sortase B